REEEPIAPTQYWRDVPSWPQRACLRCLAKNGSERYPSVCALAEEMQGWLTLQSDDLRERSKRLGSLGLLAVGAAHEISGPLAGVTNNLAVLQRDVQSLRDLLRLYREGEATLARHQPEMPGRVATLAEGIDLGDTLDNLDRLMVHSRDGLHQIQQIV